jgi:hypothetical protein
VLALIVMLGIAAVWLSISILCRGKLYRRLEPEARPRRWVAIFPAHSLFGIHHLVSDLDDLA